MGSSAKFEGARKNKNPNATQGFILEGNHMAARTFRKKKQQQRRAFFAVIFYVYTYVDNRERARASY